MSWTFDLAQIFDGDRKHIARVVGASDATAADTATIAVDKSTLTGADGAAVTRLVVYAIEWTTNVSLKVAFDHTADDEIANLTGDGFIDWSSAGGLVDPDSTGGTGDITITPVGTAANDVYTVTLWCRKKVD